MLKSLKTTLEHQYFAEHGRWVHWLPVGLVFGIGCYFSIHQEPGFLVYLILFFSAAAACVILVTKPDYRFFGYLIIGFATGFCIIGARVNFNPTPMFKTVQEKAEITGHIESIENHPYKDDGSYRVVINGVTLDKKTYPAKLRLNVPQNLGNTLEIQDHITVAATIYPIPMPSSLHGYFARRAAFLQGIGGTASANMLLHHEKSKHKTFSHYRQVLIGKILSRLKTPYSAIGSALVTGDRSYIPQPLRQAFADAGLAHILAISGLHLSLVTLIVFLMLRRLMCLWPAFSMALPVKKVAAVLAVIASMFYMTIANFGIPVQRSFIMITLAMIAVCLDRTAFSMRSLVIAATVVLLIAPESVLSASFQLSFAAVLRLLAFYESAWPKLQERVFQSSSKLLGAKKIVWGFLGICMTTFIASLATTAFSMAFFQRFTAQAILGNLLAIPLVSFAIMPLALACVFSLAFGGSDGLFWLWGKSIMILCEIANVIATLPGASIQVKAVPSQSLAIFAFGMLWLCLWKKNWRWLGMLPMLLSVVSWRMFELPIAYVSPKTDIMAYLEDDTIHISSDHPDAFLVANWAQEWGVCKHRIWPKTYHHVEDSNLILITSPKDGIDHLQQLLANGAKLNTVITFGYAKTLKKYQIKIPAVIDRDIIKYEGGIAVYKNPTRIYFLKNHFGSRPWCIQYY